MSRNLSRAVILLATALAVALPLSAGEWHNRANAECSDCHTQHNSENGQPMRTDNVAQPAPQLLRRASPLDLCLSCHDGSNPSAPDVLAPVSFVVESAAGAFPDGGGVPTGTAHHLNSPAPEVPPGGSVPMVLTCTTCHDPHGNGNYRNLRPDPTNPNINGTAIVAKQGVVANGNNPAQVYVGSNIIYKSGVAAWCGKCHGTPGDYDHRVDRPIWGAAGASFAAWSATTLPRVPVHSPDDDTLPSQDDQVTCLSCHKAHGSDHPKATIHADAGAAIDATCLECHDQ